MRTAEMDPDQTAPAGARPLGIITGEKIKKVLETNQRVRAASLSEADWRVKKHNLLVQTLQHRFCPYEPSDGMAFDSAPADRAQKGNGDGSDGAGYAALFDEVFDYNNYEDDNRRVSGLSGQMDIDEEVQVDIELQPFPLHAIFRKPHRSTEAHDSYKQQCEEDNRAPDYLHIGVRLDELFDVPSHRAWFGLLGPKGDPRVNPVRMATLQKLFNAGDMWGGEGWGEWVQGNRDFGSQKGLVQLYICRAFRRYLTRKPELD